MADHAGAHIAGFYDVFWKDRIHIVDRSDNAIIRLSKILYKEDQIFCELVRDFELYNAYETSQKFVSSTFGGRLGGVVVDNLNTGFVLGGKSSQSLSMVIQADGVDTIDGQVDYLFAGVCVDNTVRLLVTGSRLPWFLIDPQLPVTDSWEWSTDVLQAIDGTEQRIAVQPLPRQVMSLGYKISDDVENRYVEIYMRQFGNFRQGVPSWLDGCVLTSPVSLGDISLPVDSTENKDYRTGDTNFIILLDDFANFEVLTLFSVTDHVLTANSPVVLNWPKGTTVYPIRVGQWVGNRTQVLRKVTTREFTLGFESNVGRDFADESSFSTYRGSVVFEDVIGFRSNNFNRNWKWEEITTGGKVSRRSNYNFRDQPLIESRLTMYWSSFEEFVRVRGWVFARMGRQKDFWLPSNREDLSINVLRSDLNVINIAEVNYEECVDNNQLQNLVIRYLDGNRDFRQVQSVARSDNGLDLTLDSDLSQTITNSDDVQIEFMTKHRLNRDKVAFQHQWLYDGFVELSLVEIPS